MMRHINTIREQYHCIHIIWDSWNKKNLIMVLMMDMVALQFGKQEMGNMIFWQHLRIYHQTMVFMVLCNLKAILRSPIN